MKEKSNNDSSSHMSIFDDESINDEKNVNNENENKNNLVDEKEDENILKFHEQFLGKKRKPLTEEEKKQRIEKRKNRYYKANDEILQLFEKIDNDEITPNNINHLMSLLAKDLSDTKKISNRKALIFNKKKEIFERLLNLTFEEYQLFWYKLTDGKLKKGNAQHIKSSNIPKAKEILNSLEEKKNENEINKNNEEEKNLININSKNNKTIKELIQAADLRDNEIEKLNEEILGADDDISSDESLSSSSSDLDEDNDNDNSSSIIDNKNIDIKNEEKEEKERKENEDKKRKEKEEKEKKEKEKEKEKENKEKILKKIMEEKDEIDIFN